MTTSSITQGHESGDHFLQFNRSILKLDEEPSIRNKEETENLFSEFYLQVRFASSLEQVKAINVDHELIKIYSANEIVLNDYPIKTKLRSLFIAVIIQQLVAIKYSHDPNFFIKAETELNNIWETFAALDDESERQSLRDFYIVLREAKSWQLQPKWEKLAFYTCSIAVNEGIWYCPGGAAKGPTCMRKELLSVVDGQFPFEKKNKTVRRAKPRGTGHCNATTVDLTKEDETTEEVPKSTVNMKKKRKVICVASLLVNENESSEDQEQDSKWCKVADNAGHSKSTSSMDVTEFIYGTEEAFYPSYTRHYFDETSDLWSYI